MHTKEQLINVAMICTGLLVLSSLSGLYSYFTVFTTYGFRSFSLLFQLVPVLLLLGLFAWGLADLNQYRLTDRENRGIRVLRIWALLMAVTYPVYTVAILQHQFFALETLVPSYLVVINLLQTVVYILLALTLYRLYKRQPQRQQVNLDTVKAGSHQKRFLNLLIDTISILYFLVMLISPVMLLLGSNDRVEKMVEFLFAPLAAVATVLYYALTELIYGQSLGKAMTNTQVYFGLKVTSKAATVWQRSFSRIVPFEVISIFMQDGPWHDAWTDTKVSDFKVAGFEIEERSSQHDVLDDGFIKRF